MTSYTDIIQEIEELQPYREYSCSKCGYKQKAFVLLIHKNCEQCGERAKLRGYGSIGTEIHDVLDAMLDWMGQGEEFEELLKWKKTRDSQPNNE
jgi:hypothetical protein